MAAATAAGDRAAAHQRAGRHHQLHHLRPRPAAARVRRSQGRRQSRRAPRPCRRDGAGARRPRIRADAGDVRDRRRRRRRIDRRHHGRRAFRLRWRDHRRADRIGAVGAAQHRPHRARARHHHRCPLSLRARRRSGVHGAGAGAGDRDGARFLRRRADRNRGGRLCRPRTQDRHLPDAGGEAADRPRRAQRRKHRHPVAARLLDQGFRLCRRRRGAVMAAGHRRQGRSGRGGHAHSWRRQHRAAAADQPRRRQWQDPDDAADPHAHRPAGARRARHDGGRDLVVHPRPACETVRRRRSQPQAVEPDRRRYDVDAAFAAAGAAGGGAAQRRQGHRRRRAVRSVGHL